MTKPLPVMKQQCSTCPFRKGGLEEVRPLLEARAISEASPICHSTGKALTCVTKKKTLGKAHLCRGARDFQLVIFYRLGVIEAPTDQAWAAKCKEMGIRSIAK